jgi:hypothetical protein
MPAPSERWFRKLLQLLFAIFCFEMGLFLVLFPWFGHWEINYFAWFSPSSANALDTAQRWRAIWLSPYFRGAVSGLGLVNIYIALTEVFRLKRFSPAPPPPASPRVSIE